jgi:hypothetical protein
VPDDTLIGKPEACLAELRHWTTEWGVSQFSLQCSPTSKTDLTSFRSG